MKVILQGHGAVELGQHDFVAQGGQASVYVKSGTAYKIYTDAKDAIPIEKFHALSAIRDPAVVRPKTLLLDPKKNTPVGYAMDAVTAPHSFCQLFTQPFRDRHKVDPKQLPVLAGKLRAHVLGVHQADIVIVDLNELNLLVPQSFDEVFLIDVDSYQTAHFPATVIMPSVRDYSASRFTRLSDWYSYAILAFQLFVGAHPFKGKLDHPDIASVPKDERMAWRMHRHLSAFRKEATLAPCCPSFDVIPEALRDWLRIVLDGGQRLPPPDLSALPASVLGYVAPRALASAGELTVELVENLGEFIAGYSDGLFLVRTAGVPRVVWTADLPHTARTPTWSGAWMKELGTGQTLLGYTPKMKYPIALRLHGRELSFYDFERQKKTELLLRADEIAKSGDRLYVRSGSAVLEVSFSERPEGVTALPATAVADVAHQASRLYEGCAVQSVLGSAFVSLFARPRAGYQVKVPELDGVQVLDAKFQACTHGGVLVVLGAKSQSYHRFVFRFDVHYRQYDVRIANDALPGLCNFVCLPTSGITASLVSEASGDVLEVFVAVKGSATLRRIESPLLGVDLRLVQVQEGIGFTRGTELYRLRLK